MSQQLPLLLIAEQAVSWHNLVPGHVGHKLHLQERLYPLPRLVDCLDSLYQKQGARKMRVLGTKIRAYSDTRCRTMYEGSARHGGGTKAHPNTRQPHMYYSYTTQQGSSFTFLPYGVSTSFTTTIAHVTASASRISAILIVGCWPQRCTVSVCAAMCALFRLSCTMRTRAATDSDWHTFGHP